MLDLLNCAEDLIFTGLVQMIEDTVTFTDDNMRRLFKAAFLSIWA